MPKAGRFIAILILLTGWLAAAGGAASVRAAGQPPGPDRFAVMTVDVTSYAWWLTQWADNQVICDVFVDHEGLPTSGEIYRACGETIYNQWLATPPCPQAAAGEDTAACTGYYLHFSASAPTRREISVTLPPAVVWLSLGGCTPEPPANRCESLPTLVLTGEEPLPNEFITSIEGALDGKAFTCGPACELPLSKTGKDGAPLLFWAYSTYGDSSETFEAQVRVVEAEDGWYVDVLSSQWTGPPAGDCAQAWEALPPPGGPPPWLATPDDPADLASSIPYDYLAGNLIAGGVVDVSACPDGGLLPSGAASTCGQEAARRAVNDWQNRFDALILEVAQDTGIPGQLLKNLFSRESQFWPGVLRGTPEAGLGQMTENGADTALLWNPSFYEQFCPLVLANDTCQKGYVRLKEEQQTLLRGALLRSVNAFCADCPLALDLSKADLSVDIFAQTLLGNCAQTGRILRNVSGKAPGKVSTYEDLWRFTLVNYNAGPGCLSLAVQNTHRAGKPLDWENIAAQLTPVCRGAIDYVTDISQ